MDNVPKVDKAPQATEPKQTDNGSHNPLEKPVEKFDMPLSEAVRADKLSTLPEAEAPEVTYTQPNPTEAKPRNKKLLWGVIGGVAGAAIAASAVIGFSNNVSADTDKENIPPPTDPKATSEPSPVASPEVSAPVVVAGENDPVVTPENQADVLASLEISTSLTPEEVGTKTIENFSRWSMAGATFDTWNNQDFSVTPEEYSASIARKNADTYKLALFGADADSNPNESVHNFFNGLEKTNGENIDFYLKTYGDAEHPNSNPANIEPYKYTTEATDVDLISDDGNTLVIKVVELAQNNADKTMYGNKTQTRAEATITYSKVGDTYIITDVFQRIIP